MVTFVLNFIHESQSIFPHILLPKFYELEKLQNMKGRYEISFNMVLLFPSRYSKFESESQTQI